MDQDPPEEISELWRQHHRQVYAYALRRTDPSSAQEVVSDTFLVAWRRRHEVPKHEPLPWLIGVARLVMANQVRGQHRQDALGELLAQRASDNNETAADPDRLLLRALAALKPSDREALLLVAWDGLTPAQAALSLSCSGSAFRVRLLRARRRLRALLDPSSEHTAATAAERPGYERA
jgi:RNA polymerase sigma factor (sigma-70 family)